MTSNGTSAFVYTGKESVPKDVTAVKFSPSISEVGDAAFRNCKQLKDVVLNEGLQKIGKCAFFGCSSLESINFTSTITEVGGVAFGQCKQLKFVVLNEGLQKIGKGAFSKCSSLESIRFPTTISKVGGHAFLKCDQLNDVVLNEGLQKIGEGAFYECSSLESIKFPFTISEVGYQAFGKCDQLKVVVLNKGLQKIGEGAFLECSSLESIRFPSTITEVGDRAFSRCNQLKDVVLNEGLQKIGEGAFSEWGAFYECSSLESFKFPCVSTRVEAISSDSDQTEIVTKIHEIPGVAMRGGEILISGAALGGGTDWTTCRESLDRILGLITYYELKEATTIFELSLWKAKMEEDNMINDDNCETCRVEVPGPVKDAVLQFFTYNRRW